ncbi:MAG: galactose mutarotase [Clostridia bacterium]|nr:galactose mutarotase [Clostridia bacterium]
MRNGNGTSVTVLDYGGTIQSIVFPDRNNTPTDVTLGYDDVASYEQGTCYYGAIVGRYANRIGGGRFVLDGKEYLLEKNEEHNHVHGVFAKKMFDAKIEGEELVLSYLSPDMEEGYPGNLSVEVRYRLSEDDALSISYKATTDAPTVLNLTNHCYFNLNGQDGSTILDHKVRLNSSHYTEYKETFAQTGKIISVDGTPLDFRKEQVIGSRFNDDYYQLRLCTGYDHNMILDGEEGALKPIGSAKSDKTGICVEAFTTEPAVHFYSGNYMHFDGAKNGKNGVRYPKNGGLCFEAQHYPDSVNHPNFPSTVLRPGEVYTQKTVYALKHF